MQLKPEYEGKVIPVEIKGYEGEREDIARLQAITELSKTHEEDADYLSENQFNGNLYLFLKSQRYDEKGKEIQGFRFTNQAHPLRVIIHKNETLEELGTEDLTDPLPRVLNA